MSAPELPGIGVFGTGTAVRCLVPILKYHGFKVEAIWGRTKDSVEECAKDLQISFKTNKVDDVLLHKDVDLVFIHCPPHLQAPIAAKALGIGKHVICGTPAGPSQVDALKMVHAAEYYPKLMSLMCNGLRFLPCFQKMKQMIDDGYLGNINVVEARVYCGSFVKDKYDWMCDELMGGGVLNAYGSIIIDLITYLTKQHAVRVHGMLRTFTKSTEKIRGIRQITSDDFCTFQMELDKGACVTGTINSHIPGQYVHEVLICGTKGRLAVRGMDLFGTKNDAAKEEIFHHEAPDILDQERTGVSESIRADIPIPHLKGLMRLIHSVKDAFKMVPEDKHAWSEYPVSQASTFKDGQYIQTVVDMLRKSSRSRDWVKIDILSEEPDPAPYLSDAMRRSTFSLR